MAAGCILNRRRESQVEIPGQNETALTLRRIDMGVWSKSNPCPACGRTGGNQIKCANCGTVGCSDGNCKHGGPDPHCKICNKQTKKVKL
jgi:hypothetical protein